MPANWSRDYEIDMNPTNSSVALVIGTGHLARGICRHLTLRQINPARASDPNQINIGLAPEFIFWIPDQPQARVPEILLNLAASVSARLTIVYPSGEGNDAALALCLNRGIDARAVVLGDLYGPGIEPAPLANLWRDLRHHVIHVPDNDSLRISPLFIDDAVVGVCLAAFSSQTYGRRLRLGGTETMTILNFVYRLREEAARHTGKIAKIEIDDTVNPVTGGHFEQTIATREANELLSFRPQTKLADGLRRVVVAAAGEGGDQRISGSENQRAKASDIPTIRHAEPLALRNSDTQIAPTFRPTGSRKGKWRRPLAVLALLLLLIPSIFTLAVTLAQYSANHLATTAAGPSPWLSPRDEKYLKILTSLEPATSLWWKLLGQPNRTLDLAQIINQAQMLLMLRPQVDAATSAVQTLSRVMTGEEPAPVAVALANIDRALTGLLPGMSLMSQGPGEAGGLAELRGTLSLARELLPVVGWAVGTNQKTTLLVVLQNANELRPTGGFMNSVAFVTFEKGKFLDFTTSDIYQIDGQLLGTQDPPAPIKRVLGESTWLARDANWSADAPTAAAHIQRVIARATGRQVDGVVFVTTRGLSTILSSTGPIQTAEGKVLSAENMSERAVFDADVELSRGQRQDPMAQAAIALSSLRGEREIIKLGQGLLAAIRQEEILITSQDQSVGRVLGELGVDGAIKTAQCPVQLATCTPTSIYVVEANLGINKADYFLKRQRQVEVFVRPDGRSAETVVKLIYRNESTNNTRSAGSYRGYARVYTPLSSTISSAQELGGGNRTELLTDHDVEAGKHVTGFYLDVPSGQERVVEIRYAQPLTHEGQTAGISLLMQKQPGMGEVPTDVIINHPENFLPVTTLPMAAIQSGRVAFTATGEQSQAFSVQFMVK